MTDQPTDPATDALDPDRARQDPRGAVDALEHRVLGGTERRLDDGHPDDVGPQDDDADRTEPDTGAEFELDLDPEDQGRADAVPPAPE